MEAFEAWLARIEAHRQTTSCPLVTLSYAQSLDGSLSVRRGQPTPISGPESSLLTHRLRAAHDTILVGVGTVLADDPRLTVRHVSGEDPQPVILDGRLRTPPEAHLLRQHPKPAWIATSLQADPHKKSRLEKAGGRLLPLPSDPSGRVDLASLLACLAELGVHSLMVEGGARVITSFLTQRLADQAFITIAPIFLGGLRAIEDQLIQEDPHALADYPRLEDPDYMRVGDDFVVWGSLARK